MNKQFIQNNIEPLFVFLKFLKLFIIFNLGFTIYNYLIYDFSTFLLINIIFIHIFAFGMSRIISKLGKKIFKIKNIFQG